MVMMMINDVDINYYFCYTKVNLHILAFLLINNILRRPVQMKRFENLRLEPLIHVIPEEGGTVNGFVSCLCTVVLNFLIVR
jgi:hypothetical protein